MKKLLYIILSLTVLACADAGEELYSSNNSQHLNGPQGAVGPAGEYNDFAGQRLQLLSGKWLLEAYESGPVTKSAVLEFKTQRNLAGNYILSGISTVNFYEAGYSLSSSDGIRITQLSMTEMGGLAEDMAFEKKYFERLVSMTAFSFRNKKLVLRNAKGEEMVFK